MHAYRKAAIHTRAELLNLASLDARIAGTVAVAPTCMRFQGFVSYTVPRLDPAFSWEGKPLDYVKLLFGAGDPNELYRKALDDPKNADA